MSDVPVTRCHQLCMFMRRVSDMVRVWFLCCICSQLPLNSISVSYPHECSILLSNEGTAYQKSIPCIIAIPHECSILLSNEGTAYLGRFSLAIPMNVRSYYRTRALPIYENVWSIPGDECNIEDLILLCLEFDVWAC